MYDTVRQDAFTFNRSARAVWVLCDGNRTIAEIAAELGSWTRLPEDALMIDVRASIERLFIVGSPWTHYVAGIVGAARCTKNACDLSRGIVVNRAARTVTFHLTAPDPEFLYKLALTSAHVLPASTPTRPSGTKPLPATGPYMISAYRPRHLVTLVRNPFFREWSQAAQPDGYPDRIEVRLDLPYERMDDLQLAVLSMLDAVAGDETTVEVQAADHRVGERGRRAPAAGFEHLPHLGDRETFGERQRQQVDFSPGDLADHIHRRQRPIESILSGLELPRAVAVHVGGGGVERDAAVAYHEHPVEVLGHGSQLVGNEENRATSVACRAQRVAITCVRAGTDRQLPTAMCKPRPRRSPCFVLRGEHSGTSRVATAPVGCE